MFSRCALDKVTIRVPRTSEACRANIPTTVYCEDLPRAVKAAIKPVGIEKRSSPHLKSTDGRIYLNAGILLMYETRYREGEEEMPPNPYRYPRPSRERARLVMKAQEAETGQLRNPSGIVLERLGLLFDVVKGNWT